MDSALTKAARALELGDPLAALAQVALREDATALALRGIAMAQLGELVQAKRLLRLAGRRFGPAESAARARCATAEAEIALAAREFTMPAQGLDDAIRTLEVEGDRANSLHARLLVARRSLWLGQLEDAERALARLDLRAAPAVLQATAELVAFDLAFRREHALPARAALARARRAAVRTRIPALVAEIEQAEQTLRGPAARLTVHGQSRLVPMAQVQVVLSSSALVVDGRRRQVSRGGKLVSLAGRPVLFALLRVLAETFPNEASREALVWAAFGLRRVSPSLRVRMRVELGRLRKALSGLAAIQATTLGFVLIPAGTGAKGAARSAGVAVLAPPVEGGNAALLGLLSDGVAWSSSALAMALGSSQRTVQRDLGVLEEAGHVESFGQGRSQRWIVRPVSGITTAMLLASPAAIG